MAWSPAFYGDLGGMRERVLVMGSGMSYNYANPATRTGEPIQVAEHFHRSREHRCWVGVRRHRQVQGRGHRFEL